ncbi:MAG TPA: YncE family protein [Acidimicrobiales bacterium]|nr:YncE family protein [Acidimicrobiales bacterium]
MARRRRIFVLVALLLVLVGLVALFRTGSSSHPRRPSTVSTAPSTAGTSLTSPGGIYSHAGAGMLSPTVAGDPYRLYVPESAGTGIDVIDPSTDRVIAHYATGLDPQHVVPAYDMRTLYVTNDMANSLTPIDPSTGAIAGPDIHVDDPYNLYFVPGGHQAVVMAEARHRIDFYDLPGFRLAKRLPVPCPGVNHADFSADGSYLIASCEFGARLIKVDLATQTVTDQLDLPGSSPQDVRVDETGKTFWVADMNLGGVHLIDAATFQQVGFILTGKDAHGIYPSRDATDMYVSNRGSGTVSVVDVATRAVTATWTIPGGGSPDMGGVSADGSTLWMSGRYNSVVYGFSTKTGQVIARIPVPNKPHGLCVWPQPGRFSLGHTGNMR